MAEDITVVFSPPPKKYWALAYNQLRELVEAYLKVNAMEYKDTKVPEEALQEYEKKLTKELVKQGVLTLREQQHLSPLDAHDLIVSHIINEFPLFMEDISDDEN